MFFKGSAGYQPSAREVWHAQQRRDEYVWKKQDRQEEAAEKIYAELPGQIQSIHDQGAKQVAAAVSEIEKPAAAEVKRLLGAGVTQYTGANPENIVRVWHWRAANDAMSDLGVNRGRSDAGVLVVLPRSGGLERDHHVWRIVISDDPTRLDDPAVAQWADASRNLISETADRYPLLSKLRDNTHMATLFSAAGLTWSSTKTKEVGTPYGVLPMPVTTVTIPTITGVEVTQEGLQLTFAHRPGDSAKKWSASIDTLRNVLRAEGVDASHLRIRDAADGSIVLDFADAPNVFPRAVASEPVAAPRTEAEAIAACPTLRWRFGLDARGNEVAAVIRDNPHIGLIAQTGWGKSVMSASLIENLRPYGSWWLFDGKGSDHPVQLAQQPGISWISKTAPEHVVGMRWLWDEMNDRYIEADQRKAEGRASQAFDFPPLFVLIDETPSLRGGIESHDKNGLEKFDFWVQDLLQKGRQARIHLVIISQSLYVDSVPSTWQMNLSRVLFLGPISGRSLQSDTVPESVRERVAEMTARIPESAKGRGVFLDRSAGEVRPIQIQTYYDYSPGSVDLSMAPTPEVLSVWARQQANLEDRPLLFDRVGIQVEDSGWRSLSVEELSELPTVVVADENGLISGMEVYDPLSKSFRGAVQINSNPNRARGRGSGASAQPVATPTPAEPVSPTAHMTDEERREAVRQEAIRMGLIPADDEPTPSDAVDETPSAAPEPKKRAPRKAAPKKPEPRAGGDF